MLKIYVLIDFSTDVKIFVLFIFILVLTEYNGVCTNHLKYIICT
jgi:hypothetical protein